MKQNKSFLVFALVFTVMLIIFSLVTDLSAQPLQRKRLLPIRLPDLIVRDIHLVKGCQILVTIANIGRHGVPASLYNLPKAVGVQMYNNGKPWGGLILSGFDPKGNLKKPGGVARHIWFPNAANLKLTPGVHSIKVVVDHGNVLPEARENNNSLTQRVKCSDGTIGTDTTAVPTKPPQRFFLDFKFCHMNFNTDRKSIQIITEGNVLSYGNDWEVCQLKPYLFHLRQREWDNFYWQVNTERKEVYKVTGGTFCQIGGIKEPIDHVVTVTGTTCNIHFRDAHMAYIPSTKTLQVVARNQVLLYGGNWEKCNKAANEYHLKHKVWKGFYWKVNTLLMRVARIRGGMFCGSGGSLQVLGSTTVRVVK